jgi:polyketide synthase PksN
MREKTLINSKEILCALQSGTMSLEDAKKELTKKKEPVYSGKPEKNTLSDKSSQNSIAIIGMSGQFPKSNTLDTYWDNLANGIDCISAIPETRWSVDEYYDSDPKVSGKTYCKWMGVLEDIDKFDPLFFNISPIEAELMDPQHHLFLENCWRCIEDSGLSPSLLSESRCGVFVGCGVSDYDQFTVGRGLNAHDLMGSSPSILAARVSYLLNLKGPCMAIDTACSSSLVAIAEACNSLTLRTCDLALAGGVYILLGPSTFIMASKTGMLSKDGRCFTFDNRANGFVPGEGVGVILLKRLSDAVRDQDPIYGVIIGWGTNQDGKTNGITAPSVNSQILLEKDTYKRFNINPETISLVEAHGTGTKLGDPIEVEALTKSFESYTDKKIYCALGSVKSNIGHLVKAAGMAGIIKILLAMKHGMIPPTINFEALNEHIRLDNSPFYVNTELRPWATTQDFPRRAAISSFGFSGTNAHLVIEEYLPKPGIARTSIQISPDNPIPFVLSAKSKERLIAYAECMKSYIESHTDLNLVDMAYTLQTGRESMDYRLAFFAVSREDLIKSLAGFITHNSPAGVLTAQVRKSKDGVVVFEADEDAKLLLQTWIQKRKLKEIAELWVKGLSFDWNQLYGDIKPRRISLPTYPFARERYWIPVPETGSAGSGTTTTLTETAYIHPLLHQNTSDLTEQRFTSTFTGQEFFLADHVIKGQRIMPGVAYLEMARAAVEQAAASLHEGRTGIILKNVVWVQPIVIGDQPVQIHIRLFSKDNGEIAYEIYSGPDETGTEIVVYSRGNAVLDSVTEVQALDLSTLQGQCSWGGFSSRQCYDAFRAVGIEYGQGFRGIEEMHVGQGKVLAKISLPASVSDTKDQFVLHPSLLDSAIQSSVGLMMLSMNTKQSEGIAPLNPSLAFALQKLEVFSNCTSKMWVLIRKNDSSTAGEAVQKFDIDLSDENGTVCVRLKGLLSRVLQGKIETSSISGMNPSGISGQPPVRPEMLIPVWDIFSKEPGQTFPSPEDLVVIIGGTKDHRDSIKQQYLNTHILEITSNDTLNVITEKLETYGLIGHILWITPYNSLNSVTEEAIIEEQKNGVLLFFKIVKALLRLGYGGRKLGWSVITVQTQPIHQNDSVNPIHSSLHGFVGSMAKEYPNWKVRLLDLEADCDWPITDMFTLPPDPQGNAWVCREREWYQQKLIPLHHSLPAQTLYKPGGVYVVIGGAGGIGEVWSEYMMQTYQAHIIWIGRRQKDAEIQAKLNRLASIAPAPYYITADATDLKALQLAFEEIMQRYGKINGVIHSAVGLLDQSLDKLEEEQFRAGLSAKVDVSVRMAQVFYKDTLDFMLFFSSLGAFGKVSGQSSYSSGCTFEDVYAHQLSKEWSNRVKVMNWGYWDGIGIAKIVPNTFKNRLAQAGIGSIEPPEAMEALEILIAGPVNQIALVKNTKPKDSGGIISEEYISVYPENFVSNIKEIRNNISIPLLPVKLTAVSDFEDMKIKNYSGTETLEGVPCK